MLFMDKWASKILVLATSNSISFNEKSQLYWVVTIRNIFEDVFRYLIESLPELLPTNY